MRRDHLPRRGLALLLAALMLCSACSSPDQLQEGDSTLATSMSLRRTEGTVSVTDGEHNSLTPAVDLPLYGGYGLGTQAASYAWIGLDEVKLTKMDQDSDIQIQKDGKRLEIVVNRGSLFFNITRPLEADETLDIRTSTMLVGIRGTCGWVSAQEDTAQVCILEGTVSATVDRGHAAEGGSAGASGESRAVFAGQMAQAYAGPDGTVEVTVSSLPVQLVPDFVRVEIEEDRALAAAIQAASGLDVLASPEPEASEPGAPETDAPLPTDGDRLVFTGTLSTYTYDEVLALQGVADPNPGPHGGITYRLIVLDTPQEMALRSTDPTAGLRPGEVSLIDVSYADGLDQYEGQHLTFSIDPYSTHWPGGADLPLGQPSTSDVHVLS